MVDGLELEGGCMKIFYLKDSHVILKFGSTELRQALGVLKALAQYFRADFIFQIAQELQDDLFPKPLLPYRHHVHLCEKCFRMMDIDKEAHLHHYGKDKDYYTHQNCPPLQEESKRER